MFNLFRAIRELTSNDVLRNAVRRLGPERSLMGLRAFGGGNQGSWDKCVLARAYGEIGELSAMATGMYHIDWSFSVAVAKVLGLTARQVKAVARAFDHQGPERVRLKSLLQLEAAKRGGVPLELFDADRNSSYAEIL